MTDDDPVQVAGDLLATTANAIASAFITAFPDAHLDVSSEVAASGDSYSVTIYPNRDAAEGGSDFLFGGNLCLSRDAARSWTERFANALVEAKIGYSFEIVGDQELLSDRRHDEIVAARAAVAPAKQPSPTWTLDRGRIAIGARRLSGTGDEVREGWLVADPSTKLLVTLSGRHAESYEDLRRRFGLRFEGIAPIEYLGVGAETPYPDALVERAIGTPAAPIIAERDLVRIAVDLAMTLARVHDAGERVGAVRPELVFLREGTVLLAPRGPGFIAATPLARGLRCYRVPYLSPEELVGHRGGPASDVFSLCASLFFLGTGSHPYGDPEQVSAVAARLATGAADPWPGAGSFGELLGAGMQNAPIKRPPASKLAELLTRCV